MRQHQCRSIQHPKKRELTPVKAREAGDHKGTGCRPKGKKLPARIGKT